MLDSSIRLGKIAGISIGINYSLLFIAALVTLQLATVQFPSQAPGYSENMYLVVGVLTALLFFASILWHELAHGLMAKYFRVRVKRIVLFFMGGIAEMEDEPRTANQEFWIAILGPLSSLVLGLSFLGLGLATADGNIYHIMFVWLGNINIILAVFNMIPGFPLDGGRVLRAILWWGTGSYLRSTQLASYVGQGFAYLALLGGGILIFAIDPFTGVWGIIMGLFLLNAARSHLQSAQVRHQLQGIPIGTVVRRGSHVEAEWPLAYATDIMAMSGPVSGIPVKHNNQLVGILTQDTIRALHHLNWAGLRVADVMKPIQTVRTVDAYRDLYDALRDPVLHREPYVLVMANQQPLGLLSQGEILAFAERRARAT